MVSVTSSKVDRIPRSLTQWVPDFRKNNPYEAKRKLCRERSGAFLALIVCGSHSPQLAAGSFI
mgnify:CR=1 FL=1